VKLKIQAAPHVGLGCAEANVAIREGHRSVAANADDVRSRQGTTL